MDRNSGGGNAEDSSSGSWQSGGSRSGESDISGGSGRAGSWACGGAGLVSRNSSTTTTTTTNTSASAAVETARNSLARVKLHSIEKSLAVSDWPTSVSRVEHHNLPADIPNVVEYHLKVKRESKSSSVVTPESKKACKNLQPPCCPNLLLGAAGIHQKYRYKRMGHLVGSCCSRDQIAAGMEEEYLGGSILKDKTRWFTRALCRLSIDNNVFEGSQELPQIFQVKYLGSHDARGLWGIKHTRKPVDNMVAAAKALPTSTMLPLVKLIVTKEGVAFMPLEKKKQDLDSTKVYPIETISYGVQDLTYTRVFCMIVVRESDHFRKVAPFVCHAFVCESKQHARQLTYALATAFHVYSNIVKTKTQPKEHSILINSADAVDNKTADAPTATAGSLTDSLETISRCAAIDLRSCEEIDGDYALDSEA